MQKLIASLTAEQIALASVGTESNEDIIRHRNLWIAFIEAFPKLVAYIRSLEDRNVDISTTNKMLLTRQAALEADHRAMRDAHERIASCESRWAGDCPNISQQTIRSLLIKP